jgi:hypothetical protein
MKFVFKSLYGLLLALAILLSSCGYTEKDAEKLAGDFLTALKYENHEETDLLYPDYPTFHRYKALENYEIEKVTAKENNSFIVFGKVDFLYSNNNKFTLYIEEEKGKLIIKDSKGFYFKWGKDYMFCEKIKCISSSDTDTQIRGIIEKSCKNYEDRLAYALPIFLDLDKDIIVKEKKSRLDKYAINQYIEVTVENLSDVYFKGTSYFVKVDFYDNKNGLLESFVINNDNDDLLPGSKITFSSTQKIGFISFRVPYDASRYSTYFMLNDRDLENIAYHNQRLFSFGCK